ncbi:MAG: SAM-dependent methyltransferase [Deltaproteobacteria bacterium]|nr:MAG: SAM-dependent methyltransferase [Deltaproteobacteria bacterium]
MMSEARIHSQSSLTAKIVCYMRALSYLEAGPPVANDHLAELFLSPKARKRIQSAEERQDILVNESLPANYSYITARTRHLDQCVQQALQEDFEQIVILGAGFDSRAYRFADELGKTQVFEVDAPTTQEAKLKYLDLGGIDIPETVTYVPVNFNQQTLAETLLPAGLRADAKTLFLWEGVTYYISAEAVDQTLKFVQEHAGPGSRIAFDWLYARLPAGDTSDHGAAMASMAVAAIGEPFVFGIQEGSIDSFLQERGFQLLANYPPHVLQDTYLDDTFPQMYGFMVNTVAEVLR